MLPPLLLPPPPPPTPQPPQQLRQQGLCMSSFSSDYAGVPSVLAALPAQSLTCLHVDLESKLDVLANGPALAAALAGLTNLRHLCLKNGYDCRYPGSCLAGLAQLTRLTHLSIEGCCWQSVQQPVQQLAMRAVSLQYLQLDMPETAYDRQPLDLRRLTRLAELSTQGLPKGSRLPAQLQRLLYGPFDLRSTPAMVMPLQQLQRLEVGITSESLVSEPLLRLGQLPALTHLSLQYYEFPEAAATAAAWPRLPQLRQLSIEYLGGATKAQLAGVLAAVAASSGLTNLTLEINADDVAPPGLREPADQFLGIAACASLAGLTRLRDLSLGRSSSLAPGDALALSALTSLTRLVLGGTSQGTDDVAATALACSLKQLRHLDLSWCKLGDMACLAAIGQLAQLTELRLYGTPLKQRSLLLLQGLTRLQSLVVTCSQEVTPVVLRRFWAALGKQQAPAAAAGV
jgi:hypothetical protein